MMGEWWPTVGTQALYHLEDVNDSSGNAFTLTNTSSVAFANAKYNKGAVFDKSVAGRHLTRTDTIGMGRNDTHTFSMWVNLATEITSSPSRYVFWGIDFATGSINEDCIYEYNGGNPILRFRRSKNGVATQETTYLVSLGENKWHHVAGAWDGSTLYLYLDGALVASAAASGDGTNPVTNKFYIGGEGAFPMDGRADEFHMFRSRVLTSAEIRKYYAWALGRRTFFI